LQKPPSLWIFESWINTRKIQVSGQGCAYEFYGDEQPARGGRILRSLNNCGHEEPESLQGWKVEPAGANCLGVRVPDILVLARLFGTLTKPSESWLFFVRGISKEGGAMGFQPGHFKDFVGQSYVESFPTTSWSLISRLKACKGGPKNEVLEILICRYWKPVYVFLRTLGVDGHSAKDLTQDFFVRVLEKDTFAQADRSRGRFRNFIKVCVANHLRDCLRKMHAKERGHEHLNQVIETLVGAEERDLDVFDNVWVRDHITRALNRMKQEWAHNHQVHFEIFEKMLIKPFEEGVARPKAKEVAEGLNMSVRQVNNLLTTAKRAFKRCLAREVWESSFNGGDFREGLREAIEFLRQVLGGVQKKKEK
jgi:RNA polymerase sigma factor (sigma-70 family)